MKQLDLLDWKPPCQVIVFPLAKRMGKVRRVADILAEKHGAAAKSYWKQTILTMAGSSAPASECPKAPRSMRISALETGAGD
ncbi:DUF6074 family protein [Mesorhizobium sp.]|uniref:DUF6074 family protein n=1 Tax=Mesorhizobium sp. TaxID=1871066 RepID=UPI0011FD6F2A|nr:DUF6074 family protein [Mesorhizobium sp.]TIN79746.1 MAG: hypothetical protein E5Y09_04730 [Mesorhizobium sp.]